MTIKSLVNPSTTQRLPWYGWLLGGVLLLFGLFATFDNVMSMVYHEQYFRDSGMTPDQIHYFLSVPWLASLGAMLCSVTCLLGSVTLLMRLRTARVLYAISVLSNLPFIVYAYFMSGGRDAMGVLWLMPLIVTSLIAVTAFYCYRLARTGTLR